MSNSKISNLTSATTPLAGTETLPIVQSSTTKQVSVANLTAGRAISALSATFSKTVAGTYYNIVENPSTSGSLANAGWQFNTYNGTSSVAQGYTFATANTWTYGAYGANSFVVTSANSGGLVLAAVNASASITLLTGGELNANKSIVVDSSGNATINRGNIIQGTAAKGVNFTANTPAAGMTSQLLNWYEEGTWTPNQGAGLTLVGAFSSTGRYTRIGRQVSISGTVTGATSVAVTAAGVITSNLPFTVVTAGHGGATNVAINAFATVICTSTSVTSAGAIAATATITFSATYFV